MLYHLLYGLKDFWFGFNVFRYISFRAVLAAVTAFIITLFLAPILTKILRRFNIKEKTYRKDAPTLYKFHESKEGTPTMGGIIILCALIVSTVCWGNLSNKFVMMAVAVTLWLGIVGFIDDFIKLKKKQSGLRVTTKLLGQLSAGLIVGTALFMSKSFMSTLHVPFCKNLIINLGIFYIFFAAIVIVAASNAVNLTDGLDGLAIGCVIIIALTYGTLAYITGHVKLSGYLNVFYHPGAAELSVFCAAVFGSGLGFLWFNSHPASIFMGDTGSLALGGAIGVVSIFIKKEILLLLVGGIFVIEALSVILQVASYKLSGKRIFLMAPLHHHYQLKGWHENKIIIRFWIVAVILALLTLATLKLR